MMRNKPSSSMQKTYDECYLVCSTAVYFEAQVGKPEPDHHVKNIIEADLLMTARTTRAKHCDPGVLR